MSFKIDKDIGKIGEYYPIDFANSEPIYEHIDNELKEAVNKYLEKVNVTKIGFSKYTLTYIFKDSTVLSGSFYSTSHGVEYYDSDWNVI